MIEENRHKYSVSAMCEVLQIARSTFYYEIEVAARKEQEKAAEEQKLKEKILDPELFIALPKSLESCQV